MENLVISARTTWISFKKDCDLRDFNQQEVYTIYDICCSDKFIGYAWVI